MKIKHLILFILTASVMLSSCSRSSSMPADNKTETDLNQHTQMRSEAIENLPLFKKYVGFVTINDDCEINSFAYLKGEEFEYAVYEVRSPEKENHPREKWYWEIVVIKDGKTSTILHKDQFQEEYTPSSNELVSEVDINFDEKNDIVLLDCYSGNSGSLEHTCYIQTDNGFAENPVYLPGRNPAISKAGHIIRTAERLWATAQEMCYYQFSNGEYVPVERITLIPHKYVYSAYNDAQEWLGDDESVYDTVDYRCAVVEVFNNNEWKLNKVYAHEGDSPLYKKKHICFDENYEFIHSLGVEVVEYKDFNSHE